MTNGKLSFGIDIGSTNSKLAAVATNMGSVGELEIVSWATPSNATELRESVAQAIDSLIETVGQPEAIGIASMAESGVALDTASNPITDIVRWDGSADPAAIAESLGGDQPSQLHRSTGIAASAKVPLCMWAHLQMNSPRTWRRLHKWVGVADLLVLAMTGRMVTDHTLALRTMAVRRPRSLPAQRWEFDGDLLDRVGLTPANLPDIIGPNDWNAAAAISETRFGGLCPDIPVVVVGHDHLVGAWAAGVREPGGVADSMGTTEAIIRLFAGTDVPQGAFEAGMSVGIDVTGRYSTIIAGSANGGNLVRWWSERAGIEVQAAADHEPESAVAPVDSPTLPYLFGRQAPLPDETARLSAPPTNLDEVSADRLRALVPSLLDGMALHAQWMSETQQALIADAAASEITVIGSLHAGDALLRRKAAAFGRTLVTLNARQAVAVGAAMLAIHRIHPHQPVSTLPRYAQITPGPAETHAYARALRSFVQRASADYASTTRRTIDRQT